MNAKQKSVLAKIFAIAGTALLWAPVLFMFVTAVVGSIMSKKILFDYLTLAELFPLVAIGMVLLIVAGLISRAYAKWFGWGSAAALAALAAGLILATASGLASGALTTNSGAFVVVVVCIAAFDLIVVGLAVLGIRLIVRLFHKAGDPAETAETANA
jgi:hypothetical protein